MVVLGKFFTKKLVDNKSIEHQWS